MLPAEFFVFETHETASGVCRKAARSRMAVNRLIAIEKRGAVNLSPLVLKINALVIVGTLPSRVPLHHL